MPDKQITKWTDDEVVTLLTPDIEKAESIQNEFANQRAEYYTRYRMGAYGNEREGFSKTVAPVIHNNQKWTLANLMDIFNDDFFILKGEDEERTSKFQKLIYYQMFRKQDGFRKFFDLLFTANLYHYCVAKVHYKEDFDLEYDTYDRLSADEMMVLAQEPNITVSKYDEVTDEAGGAAYENIKVVKKVIHYAGPLLEVIPNWEFFYSPDCKITDWGAIEGRLVYHKVKRTLNDIRKREKAGIYRKGTFAAIKEKGDDVTPDAFDKIEVVFNADSVSETSTQEPSNAPENILSREVEIKECYYRLDIDGDGLLEPVIIDLCDDVVCRLVENDYRRPCFRIGHVSPEPHKVQGFAMPALLDNDQKIMTNLLRLIQDSAALDCYKNPVTNDNQMFAMLQDRKPFAVIRGDPMKLGEVKTSPPSQFVLKAWELLKGEGEEKTGITRYNQGVDASSLNKTATGIDAIFSASAKPLRLIARILGNGILMGIIRDFIFINQKWPPQTDIRILGTDVTVNPDDLTGEHEIEIDIGVSAAEKTAMANQVDLLIQFGTQAGLQMGIMTPEHMIKAQKKKYRLLGQKIDDLMVTEQEFAQKMQAQQGQQKQPSPEQMQMQMEQQRTQMEMQSKQAEMQITAQETQQKMQQEQQLFQQKMRQNEELHNQKMRQEDERHKQAVAQARSPRPGSPPG
uniref:Portal protein n=1 Tax=viral metagenome TaxID=1070528 RepID=A0A6H1ZRS3_9ZZZZ